MFNYYNREFHPFNIQRVCRLNNTSDCTHNSNLKQFKSLEKGKDKEKIFLIKKISKDIKFKAELLKSLILNIKFILECCYDLSKDFFTLLSEFDFKFANSANEIFLLKLKISSFQSNEPFNFLENLIVGNHLYYSQLKEQILTTFYYNLDIIFKLYDELSTL